MTVTSASDRLAPLLKTPPPWSARPPLIVSPESAADPPWTSNTRLTSPTLTVSSVAPGPLIVIAGPPNVSCPSVRMIVCGAVPKASGEKVMVLGA